MREKSASRISGSQVLGLPTVPAVLYQVLGILAYSPTYPPKIKNVFIPLK